jgi:hypothetical protein
MKDPNIAPEIYNDELFYNIIDLVRKHKPKSVLEIGSSTGLGSTQAFIRAISTDNLETKVCCIESMRERYAQLVRNTSEYKFIKCILASSVSSNEFLSKEEVTKFLKEHRNLKVSQYRIDRVLRWLSEDLEVIQNIPQDGITQAIRYFGHPEMVLIDGSTFSGYAEYKKIISSKIIILDDIMGIKNWHSYHNLLRRSEYSIIAENKQLRNGYAIFIRE